jgi:hypothetical protein
VTALEAVGWSAGILVFCVGAELNMHFWVWALGVGARPSSGVRQYLLVATRFMQFCAIAIGIYGLVKIA